VLLLVIVLVLAGLVLLIVGFIQDTLSLIYLSIGCAAVAGLTLMAFGRLSRRRALRLATDGPSIALRRSALDDGEGGGADPVPADQTNWVRPARSDDVAIIEPEPSPAPAKSTNALSAEAVETVEVTTVGAADRSDGRGESTWRSPTATGAPNSSGGGRQPGPGDRYPADDQYDDDSEDFDAWGDEVVFPIEEYDERRVREIVPLLSELEPDELEEVRDRESSGKNRSTILLRIDELLGRTPPRGKRAAAKATPVPGPPKRAAPAKRPAARAPASTNAAAAPPKRAASKAAAAPAPPSAKRASGKSAAPATTKRAAAKADPAATKQVAKRSRER
jgi:hypothetical protein